MALFTNVGSETAGMQLINIKLRNTIRRLRYLDWALVTLLSSMKRVNCRERASVMLEEWELMLMKIRIGLLLNSLSKRRSFRLAAHMILVVLSLRQASCSVLVIICSPS